MSATDRQEMRTSGRMSRSVEIGEEKQLQEQQCEMTHKGLEVKVTEKETNLVK
jgi:hypothetical protein